MNLQANGTERRGAGLTQVLNTDGSRTYTLDLSGLATGRAVNLSFDLIGFGAANSSVTIRDVRLSNQPVAVSDAISVAEPAVSLRSTGGSSTAKAKAKSKATAKTKAGQSRTKPGQRRPAASEVECAA
ncbi:MAG: hypothetical protein EXR27_18775 [Betaproteobacteria bacterium]|nr:hypothetical protein [Betaproteobacteria bacterium]